MNNSKHKQDLKQIRSMMEQSTRFLGLSGWSGIMAGMYALVGAFLAKQHIESLAFQENSTDYFPFLIIAIGVMVAALVTGFILTYRKAQKNNQSLFTKTSLRMLVHIGFPMVVGFFVWLGFALQGGEIYMAGMLLIFYGLGLINGSKYTVNDIRILGVANVILGIIALFYPTYGLYLWAAGFGLGHIIYGTYMWLTHEK